MKSIIPDGEYPVCFISGRSDNLELHHVYNGIAERKLSEKYGLKVWLNREIHNEIHINREMRNQLKADMQKIAMEHYDWSIEEFRLIFGKSYI